MVETDVWDMLVGRLNGPLTFRFVVQPIVAAIFAIRAGLHDAREQHEPYLAGIITDPANRIKLLLHGWKDVRRVFIVAIVLDVIYELIHFHWVYPVQAVVVATVLALIPYLLIRGPVTRVARLLKVQ